MIASDTKYRCLHFCTWESFGVSLGTPVSIWRRQLRKLFLFLYGDLKLELEVIRFSWRNGGAEFGRFF